MTAPLPVSDDQFKVQRESEAAANARFRAERDDERLAKSKPLTDGALLAALTTELEATLDALVPLIQRDQDMRAARGTLRERELGISSLEGIIAEARENAQRLVTTDMKAAVAARLEADAASAMRAEAVTQYIALKADIELYDFNAATLAIAELVTTRERLVHTIESKEARAYVLQGEADNRSAALHRVIDRNARRSALLLESTNPKRIAEAHEAEVRARTKAEHERREEAALRNAPAPKRKPAPEVAGLTVFGERVNPVAAALHSTGGPSVPARVRS
jgi:hypothetical protein